ncbi:MAG: phosphate ABC transporter permease subunit PstC [Pirellulaceae bacterium]
MSVASAKRKITRLRPRRGDKGRRRAVREVKEWTAKGVLAAAAGSSVLITLAIAGVLLYESSKFFAEVSLGEFLLGTEWAPLFNPPSFGIWALISATLVTTTIALVVALPIGTVVAIYLSEFAPFALRETIKPSLELLSAVPTVVYGYFALAWVTPALKTFLPRLDGSNMLSAGIVMGIMIIPYVSSLSEDAMRSVPMLLREGSYALGGNKFMTAWNVVVPSALSGIGAAYILGISRAIGETMIVAVAAGNQPRFTFNPLEGAQTITAFIVAASQGDPAHGTTAYQSIFAAGLALFAMTLSFNVLGYWLRRRYHQAY